jgi:hypothetical protein
MCGFRKKKLKKILILFPLWPFFCAKGQPPCSLLAWSVFLGWWVRLAGEMVVGQRGVQKGQSVVRGCKKYKKEKKTKKTKKQKTKNKKQKIATNNGCEAGPAHAKSKANPLLAAVAGLGPSWRWWWAVRCSRDSSFFLRYW